MTRETKIGLLVGLAFIIVIGILLSDHMTSTTQPPQAALIDSASNLRESVTAPAPAHPGPAPLVSIPPITPANPVLTQSEIRPPVQPPVAQIPVAQTPGETRVEVGGPVIPAGTPIAIRQNSPVVPVQPETLQDTGSVVTINDTPPATNDVVTTELEQWAQQNGEPLVPVGTKPTPVAPVATGAKNEYVAQSGDSLSKIAAKFMGTGSKANMDAIIKANPSLQKNPDLLVEGRKYVIPATPTAAIAQAPAPAPTPATPKAVPVTDVVDPLPASAPAEGGGYWYVVKDNDNLWKIAAEQLGSGNAWLQIKDLNKDILKGGETVQPNMRIRLPAKPLASVAE